MRRAAVELARRQPQGALLPPPAARLQQVGKFVDEPLPESGGGVMDGAALYPVDRVVAQAPGLPAAAVGWLGAWSVVRVFLGRVARRIGHGAGPYGVGVQTLTASRSVPSPSASAERRGRCVRAVVVHGSNGDRPIFDCCSSQFSPAQSRYSGAVARRRPTVSARSTEGWVADSGPNSPALQQDQRRFMSVVAVMLHGYDGSSSTCTFPKRAPRAGPRAPVARFFLAVGASRHRRRRGLRRCRPALWRER